jgi:hypothetical protein
LDLINNEILDKAKTIVYSFRQLLEANPTELQNLVHFQDGI